MRLRVIMILAVVVGALTAATTTVGPAHAAPEGWEPSLGYALTRDLPLPDHLTFRLGTDSEVVRDDVEAVLSELNELTGRSYEVAPGVHSYVPDPDGVHIDLSDTACSGAPPSVLACAPYSGSTSFLPYQQTFYRRVELRPVYLTGNDQQRRDILRHEVLHAFFFEHYPLLHDGALQLMHPFGGDQPGYQTGDLAGIAHTARRCESPFPDVASSARFCNHVAWAVDAGVVTGYHDNTFRPDHPISRGALVALLHRLAGSPDPTGPNPFDDTPEGHPFSDAIAWSAENGIVAGYPDGTFGHGAAVTRGGAVAFVARFRRVIDGRPPTEHVLSNDNLFIDTPPGWPFRADLTELYGDGVVDGGDKLRPGFPLTRQALSAWLFRIEAVARPADLGF